MFFCEDEDDYLAILSLLEYFSPQPANDLLCEACQDTLSEFY